MLRATSVRAPVLWTAYVLVPASGWGPLHGAPVGLPGATLLFAIWWLWSIRRTLPAHQWLLAALLLKLLAVANPVHRGFEADYFDNPQWSPPRSLTRIDRRLDQASAQSAAWRGYLRAEADTDRRKFYLRGENVVAELWVDGAQAVRLDPGAREAFAQALWPRGVHQLTVRMRSLAAQPQRFEAGMVDEAGREIPLGAPGVTVRVYPRWRLWADSALHYAGTALDALLLILLALAIAGTVFACATAVAARRTAREGRLRAIEALSAILLAASGIALAATRNPVVHAAPSAAPYAYFLTSMHVLFGDNYAGVYAAQWALACAEAVVAWKLAVKLFGPRVSAAALALATIVFAVHLAPLAMSVDWRALAIPVVVLLTFSIVRTRPYRWLPLGVGALTPANVLLVPYAALAIFWTVLFLVPPEEE